MDYTDDFSQNWRIQGSRNQPLDETNIEGFIATHGVEATKGYIMAINDIVHELEFCIYDTRPSIGKGPRPLTRVKNNCIKLLHLKENFLASLDRTLAIGKECKPRI